MRPNRPVLVTTGLTTTNAAGTRTSDDEDVKRVSAPQCCQLLLTSDGRPARVVPRVMPGRLPL